MKMRGSCVLALLLAGFMAALPGTALAGGRVGIIDVETRYPRADGWEQITEALGYSSERINEEVLADPGNLAPYGLIILDGSYSTLHEKEYGVLAEYVKAGGTLFMTWSASFWMMYEDEDGETQRRGIRGGGPMAPVTGARIVRPHIGLAEKFRVVERNPYTEGLADDFAYEMRPPYDITDESSTRRTEIYRLEAMGADTLIEVEAYYREEGEYDMETPVRSPFLTVNSYGEGETIWLACRPLELILRRSERNILRIVSNVLNSASER